jgi:mono/diheme cytochrome c family protein
MNYPVWFLPGVGGGALIALIAVLHVFVSHFAVGGGLYLIYAEKKGLAENSQGILDFTKTHARFFLLLTMVFGSITGVGIWFIIGLINPTATSFLIHTFVFGWAAEWAFFLVEIVAAFIYFYTFGKMDSLTHLKIGWIYFFSAWMSLLLVNGIICFMLTPGDWPTQQGFWQGFFNPSFWPSLFFRTCIAILLAGCYGYLTAAYTRDTAVRRSMTRFSAKWALAALVAAVPFGVWYVLILPEPAAGLVMGKSPTIAIMVQWGIAAVCGILAIMLIAGILRPGWNLRPVAFAAICCALVTMGAFEWIREAARRPYVIGEVIYSNMIAKSDVDGLKRSGFLPSALWVRNHQITAENQKAAGRELFIHQCYACHTIGGLNNDIVSRTKAMSYPALTAYLGKMHEIRPFMPPFVGNEAEAKALAAYIVGDLHGKEIKEENPTQADPGKALFENNCSSCHELDVMTAAMQGLDQQQIIKTLRTLDQISGEMKPFAGNDAQAQQLSLFLLSLNQQPAKVETSPPGLQVFEKHCSSCHEAEELPEKFAGRNRAGIFELLGRLGTINDVMPPFGGTPDEKESLADYIETRVGGKK